MAESSLESVTSTGASESMFPGYGCFTLHSRPFGSRTVIPRFTPVCLRSTSVNVAFGSGACSAPQGPRNRSRVARSDGSCHRLAPGGTGLFAFTGRFALTHAAGTIASVVAATTAASIRFMDMPLMNERRRGRSSRKPREVERIVQPQQEAPALVAARDIDPREGLTA